MTWITQKLLAPKVTNNGQDTTVDNTWTIGRLKVGASVAFEKAFVISQHQMHPYELQLPKRNATHFRISIVLHL